MLVVFKERLCESIHSYPRLHNSSHVVALCFNKEACSVANSDAHFCVKMWFVVTLFWTSCVILLVATHSFLSHMVSVFVSCKAYSCHCCWLRPVLAQGLYCTPVHEGLTGDDARMHWASRLKLVHAHISYHARYL